MNDKDKNNNKNNSNYNKNTNMDKLESSNIIQHKVISLKENTAGDIPLQSQDTNRNKINGSSEDSKDSPPKQTKKYEFCCVKDQKLCCFKSKKKVIPNNTVQAFKFEQENNTYKVSERSEPSPRNMLNKKSKNKKNQGENDDAFNKTRDAELLKSELSNIEEVNEDLSKDGKSKKKIHVAPKHNLPGNRLTIAGYMDQAMKPIKNFGSNFKYFANHQTRLDRKYKDEKKTKDNSITTDSSKNSIFSSMSNNETLGISGIQKKNTNALVEKARKLVRFNSDNETDQKVYKSEEDLSRKNSNHSVEEESPKKILNQNDTIEENPNETSTNTISNQHADNDIPIIEKKSVRVTLDQHPNVISSKEKKIKEKRLSLNQNSHIETHKEKKPNEKIDKRTSIDANTNVIPEKEKIDEEQKNVKTGLDENKNELSNEEKSLETSNEKNPGGKKEKHAKSIKEKKQKSSKGFEQKPPKEKNPKCIDKSLNDSQNENLIDQAEKPPLQDPVNNNKYEVKDNKGNLDFTVENFNNSYMMENKYNMNTNSQTNQNCNIGDNKIVNYVNNITVNVTGNITLNNDQTNTVSNMKKKESSKKLHKVNTVGHALRMVKARDGLKIVKDSPTLKDEDLNSKEHSSVRISNSERIPNSDKISNSERVPNLEKIQKPEKNNKNTNESVLEVENIE